VWLDFRVFGNGHAFALADVPFVIPSGGAMSIVIHAMPTDPMGVAGARLACLPVAS
jgi:Cu-Zn family superoxide dismutase